MLSSRQTGACQDGDSERESGSEEIRSDRRHRPGDGHQCPALINISVEKAKTKTTGRRKMAA